ncbi:hypothetical protein [Acinetobacter sp. 1125_18A]|uniref:hypothetical protein n=1 Tax=Acinetobacter sp. 1125_18A TaxID=2605959 RepID=UPI004058CF45
MRSQINTLRLVYPPISNQEAEWIKDDPEVRDSLSKSNLYMICQRPEAFFTFNHSLDNTDTIEFLLTCGDACDEGVFKLNEILEPYHDLIDQEKVKIKIEMGKKLLRIWSISLENGERKIINWFTVDKTIFEKSRASRFIDGLENFQKFTKFNLHYVGISKADDSLTRLVTNAHEKRIRILSNESSLNEGSRLTDEIILLFFGVDPLHIAQIESIEELNESTEPTTLETISIIADAEKAFVSILDSHYNHVKFKTYPKGSDGLYDRGLTRYMYLIGESLTLITDKEEIRGEYGSDYGWGEKTDAISIEGDQVFLFKFDKVIADKQ